MAKQKFQFQTQISSRAPDNLEVKKSTESASIEVGSLLQKLETATPKSIFNFKMIPRKKIRTNKKNMYPKEDMLSLKKSILNFGLLQNILVVYSMDEDRYIIEAGHRRTQAIDELIQEYSKYESSGEPNSLEDQNYELYIKNVREYEKGYPCKISDTLQDNILYDYDDEDDLEKIPANVIDSEIRLHLTNIEARNDDAVVRAKNINRLSKLYTARNKNLPRAERINVNEILAKELNLSLKQVKRYKSIEKLIPELQQEFEKRNITLKDGTNYSSLSEEEQHMILSLIRSGDKMSEESLTLLKCEKENLVNKLNKSETELSRLRNELALGDSTPLLDNNSLGVPGTLLDDNFLGVPGTLLDNNSSGVPETLLDNNSSGVPGTLLDNNSSGVPGTLLDNNSSGVPGTLLDNNSSGVPETLKQQELSRRLPSDLEQHPGNLMKEQRIIQLEKEIEHLKAKKNSFSNLNADAALLVKTELELKTVLGQCEKSLEKFILLFNEYEILYNNTSVPEGISLLSKTDFTAEFEKLLTKQINQKGV